MSEQARGAWRENSRPAGSGAWRESGDAEDVEAAVLDSLRKAMPYGVIDEWPSADVEDALIERGLVSVELGDHVGSGRLLVEPAGIELLAASGYTGAGMTPHTIESEKRNA